MEELPSWWQGVSWGDFFWWSLMIASILFPILSYLKKKSLARRNCKKLTDSVAINELANASRIAARRKKKFIVEVGITGPLMVHSPQGPFGVIAQALDADDLCKTLDAIAEIEHVSGILLTLNTPGGSVVASSMIADAIERCRKAKKMVIAYIEEMSASGGVWVMVHANSVVMHPFALTGSVGVIGPRLLRYNGVTEHSNGILGESVTAKSVSATRFSAGSGKALFDPFEKRDVAAENRFQTIIENTYEAFLRTIKYARPSAQIAVLRENGASLLSAGQALVAGLIDSVGSKKDALLVMRHALQDLNETNYLVRTLTAPRVGLLRRLLSGKSDPAAHASEIRQNIAATLTKEPVLIISDHWLFS